ncbi:hypothetical protein niasHT_018652 [Heterodera trifolii]|uniref:Uncharacterized protein n=1 Tax=Heterodera trifolii TaxID=157864 RepID=A0ABD2KZJ8_9BILA
MYGAKALPLQVQYWKKRNELDDLFLQVERAHRPLPPLFHNDDEAQKAVVGKRLVTDNSEKSGTSVANPKRVKMTLDYFLMDVEIRAEKDGARTTPQIVSDKTDKQQKQNDRVLEKPLANMCSTSTTIKCKRERKRRNNLRATKRINNSKITRLPESYMATKSGQSTKKGEKIGSGTWAN